MTAPWEKYAPAADTGPWAKYAQRGGGGSGEDRSPLQLIEQGRRDVSAGAIRGAGSIGATLLTPYDLAAGNTSSIGNPERRAAMDAALREFGVNTDSALYGVGKLGGEIAGTAGIGPAFAVPARALGASPAVVNALATAGARAGGATGFPALALRTGAAGTVGGASAALVDPDTAGTGATIGAVTPGVLKLAERLGAAGAALIRPLYARGQQAVVDDILRRHAANPDAALAALRQASQVVPGSAPTAAAAAGDAGLAGLTRGMQSSSPEFAAELANRFTQQNTARTAAFEDIAGNPGKIAIAKDARKAATDAMRDDVLSRARPISGKALTDAIDFLMADPDNAAPLVQATLSKYRAAVAGLGDDISARSLYAVRKEIGDAMQGRFSGSEGNMRYVKGQLGHLQSIFDDAIEGAARRPMSTSTAVGMPGPNLSIGGTGQPPATTSWADYLRTYAEASKPINRMETLQDLLHQTQTGSVDMAGNLQLSPAKLNNLLKNQGDDLAKILTPDELQVVRNIAADMNAGQLGIMAGKAVGSNTRQNMAQDQLLRAALGKLGASSFAQNTIGNLMKLPYIRANEQLQSQLGGALLDPAAVARALEGGRHVPLSDLLNPQILYRAAPLLPASAGR